MKVCEKSGAEISKPTGDKCREHGLAWAVVFKVLFTWEEFSKLYRESEEFRRTVVAKIQLLQDAGATEAPKQIVTIKDCLMQFLRTKQSVQTVSEATLKSYFAKGKA